MRTSRLVQKAVARAARQIAEEMPRELQAQIEGHEQKAEELIREARELQWKSLGMVMGFFHNKP